MQSAEGAAQGARARKKKNKNKFKQHPGTVAEVFHGSRKDSMKNDPILVPAVGNKGRNHRVPAAGAVSMSAEDAELSGPPANRSHPAKRSRTSAERMQQGSEQHISRAASVLDLAMPCEAAECSGCRDGTGYLGLHRKIGKGRPKPASIADANHLASRPKVRVAGLTAPASVQRERESSGNGSSTATRPEKSQRAPGMAGLAASGLLASPGSDLQQARQWQQPKKFPRKRKRKRGRGAHGGAVAAEPDGAGAGAASTEGPPGKPVLATNVVLPAKGKPGLLELILASY
jgi:hypothetical protein